MAKRKHIIIGCGVAALSALKKIREMTIDDEVSLVTMDDYRPYSPASLPSLLSGRLTEACLWMKEENYFKDLRSTLKSGKEVTQVLPDRKKVVYRDGSSEEYDTLLIASGSEPVVPPIQGLKEAGVSSLRTLTDCRRIIQQLKGKNNVAILGAGMVGMAIAAALLEKGYRVSLIEKQSGILSQYFNEEVGDYIRDIFTDHQARFFMGKEVKSIKRMGKKLRIALSDGSSLDTDILINATGVKSRVSFLEGSGVRIGTSGILVDKRMRTNVDHIYVAGDVAEAHDFFTGKPKMNAIIHSAVTQGRIAGANMAGGNAEYEGGIPVMTLHFFENQGFSIGLTAPQSSNGQVYKQADDRKRSFRKLIFEDDRLVGGMFLNDKIDPGIILYLIERRTSMAPYKEALFERTKPLSNPWLSSLKFVPNYLYSL